MRVLKAPLSALLLAGAGLTVAAQTPQVERIERGNLLLENVAEPSATTRVALAPYSDIRSAGFSGWRPDGKGMLILTRFAQTAQLHSVALPGAARFQLSWYDEPVANVLPSPNPAQPRVIYARDQGGNEQFALYALDLRDGRSTKLTADGSRNIQPVFSADGQTLAFGSNARNSADTDVWIWTAEGGRRILTQAEGAWSPSAFSADGKRLIVGRTISINDVRLSLVDVAGGEPQELVRAGGISTYGGGYAAAFVDSDRAVIYASSVGAQFASLRRIDLDTRTEQPFGPAIKWDISEFSLSPDGRRIAAVWNEDGTSVLRILDAANGELLRELKPGTGVISRVEFSADSAQLGFSASRPQLPGDAFALDLADGTLTRWTHSESGGLAPESFLAADLIRYRSFDQIDGASREIPAYVYRPQGSGPFPVLIDIHGGPEAQERPSFDPWIQFLAREMKVAVIAPNVRGSSGYGRSSLDSDNGLARMDSVRDIGSLLDWIATQPQFDAQRVMVYGGSYGGFMVLASMVEYSERLAGGVAIVAISNLRTFLENTSRYRVDLRRVEYGDEREPEMRKFMERTAPLNNASRISRPLFVIHGANDPRVPASEAEQMLAAVRDNGAEAWYLLARDEGHGFRKQANRQAMQAAVAAFIETVLLAPPPPPIATAADNDG